MNEFNLHNKRTADGVMVARDVRYLLHKLIVITNRKCFPNVISMNVCEAREEGMCGQCSYFFSVVIIIITILIVMLLVFDISSW